MPRFRIATLMLLIAGAALIAVAVRRTGNWGLGIWFVVLTAIRLLRLESRIQNAQSDSEYP